MENKRLLLFVLLSLVILLIWEAWQQETAPKPTPATTASAPAAPTDLPHATATPEARDAPAAQGELAPVQPIRVRTDVLDVEIAPIGGDLRKAKLLEYPINLDRPDKPVVLLNDTPPEVFVAQSGLLSSQPAPDHHARFTPEQTRYELRPGTNELLVRMHWTSPEGITVTKTYTFQRGSYLVKLKQEVTNAGAQEWRGSQYRQLQRSRSDRESFFIYTYTGGVIYSPDSKYRKIDFDDMDDQVLAANLKGGWAAMIQHYFVGAWIPHQDQQNHFYTKALGNNRYVLGMVSPQMAVAPGATGQFESDLYIGPKVQDKLEKIAPGLELTVDYGMLTFIAKPLFWVMDWIYKVVHNWGWAILILTLIIKLVFYPLSAASYRSMANMRRLAPKLQQIKERYGDDRQRMSQAMMDIYKKEKINPLGGCLPMLVQIPVFLALYWVLVESVEMRQAPWILWINDLSSKDPYYILPLIMGATMFIQQKLNPPPPDPVQAKIFMALPFIFTAFFAFFPAGLVLYWAANNLLSIAQQWHITRRIERAAEAAAAAKK